MSIQQYKQLFPDFTSLLANPSSDLSLPDTLSSMDWKQISQLVPSLNSKQIFSVHKKMNPELRKQIYEPFQRAKTAEEWKNLVDKMPVVAVIIALNGLYHGNGQAAETIIESCTDEEKGLAFFHYLDAPQLKYNVEKLPPESRPCAIEELSQAQKYAIACQQQIENVPNLTMKQVVTLLKECDDYELHSIASALTKPQKDALTQSIRQASTVSTCKQIFSSWPLALLKLFLLSIQGGAGFFTYMPKAYWPSLLTVMSNRQVLEAITMDSKYKDEIISLLNDPQRKLHVNALLDLSNDDGKAPAPTRISSAPPENSQSAISNVKNLSLEEVLSLSSRASDDQIKYISQKISSPVKAELFEKALASNRNERQAILCQTPLYELKLLLMALENSWQLLDCMPRDEWKYLVPLMSQKQVESILNYQKQSGDCYEIFTDKDKEYFVTCLSNKQRSDYVNLLLVNAYQAKELNINGKEINHELKISSSTRSSDGDGFVLKDPQNLEKRLQEQLFGQEHAVHEVSRAMLRYIAGLKDEEKPIGSFLLVGPTGVGKTELAKCMAKEVYGATNKMIRIDMSEYQQEHQVNRLIGAPPGYAGHAAGGQLTNAIKENPKSIVLLDEIEKAHPNVWKVFLQVFDEGRITDGKGETINCCEVLFIVTSNLFANQITQKLKSGISRESVLDSLKPQMIDQLSPELYARFDRVIPMNVITKDVIKKVIPFKLESFRKKISNLKKTPMNLVWEQDITDYVERHGFDENLGLRPLQRVIESDLKNSLTDPILRGEIAKDDTVQLYVKNDQVFARKASL